MRVAVLVLTAPIVEQWEEGLLDEFQGREKLLEFSELRHAGLYHRLKGKAVDTVVYC